MFQSNDRPLKDCEKASWLSSSSCEDVLPNSIYSEWNDLVFFIFYCECSFVLEMEQNYEAHLQWQRLQVILSKPRAVVLIKIESKTSKYNLSCMLAYI